MPNGAPGLVMKVLVAAIPLGLGGLFTVAWQNSHTLTAHARDIENLRIDYERTKTALLPGQTIMLRFEQNERELAHLRTLIEDNLACKAPERR